MTTLSECITPIGVVLDTTDIARALELWRGRFGFETVCTEDGMTVVRQNGFSVLLRTTDTKNAPVAVAGMRGVEHVALATGDAKRAMDDRAFAGIRLNTNDGEPFENPGVWGKGTLYFDWVDGEDTKIELCQRLDKKEENQLPFWGASHIGISAGNYGESLRFYENLGFALDCQVQNNSEADGRFVCGMLEKDGCWLEIYEMLDETRKVPGAGAIKGLLFECGDVDAARATAERAGVRICGCEEWPLGRCLVAAAPDGARVFFLENLQRACER